jgi:hypothetical protein
MCSHFSKIGKLVTEKGAPLALRALIVFLSLIAYQSSCSVAEAQVPACTDDALADWQGERSAKSLELDNLSVRLGLNKVACGARKANLKKKIKKLTKLTKQLESECKGAGNLDSCLKAKAKLLALKAAIEKKERVKVSCRKRRRAIRREISGKQAALSVIDQFIEDCQPLLSPPQATPDPTPTPVAPLPSLPVPECADGIDNDEDGLVDAAQDPGCENADDDSESSEGLQLADQVTQWGITFAFDKPYRTGQFVNGDYWVAPDAPGGTVTIVQTLPLSANGRHGLELNPSREHGIWQPYDSRVNMYQAALLPVLPLQVKAGDAVLKVISGEEACSYPVNLQCLTTAAVLTVLDEVPVQRGATFFRPPYVKGVKKLVSVNQIDWTLIPFFEVPPGAGSPNIAQYENQLERVQIDHLAIHEGRHKPKLNSKSYGQDISIRNNELMLALFTSSDAKVRFDLTVQMVQYGLDLFSFLEDGQHWEAAGGHGYGRLLPVVFAGAVLHDEVIKSFLQTEDEYRFGETNSTYVSPTTGKALYGEVMSACTEFQYWDAMRSHGTARACRDPYPAQGSIDGGEIAGAVYQSQVAGTVQATFMIFKLMPSLSEFFYDAGFMGYAKRWLLHGASTSGDTCAPAVGVCDGGINPGLATTSAKASIDCLGIPNSGVPAKFEADMSQYGEAFGPNGSGGCIEDTDPSDGIGRFPLQDGVYGESGLTPFQKAIRNAYLVVE